MEAKKRDAERGRSAGSDGPDPCDDGFRGTLPTGAIRANTRRQRRGWGDEPIYFYEDLPFTCRECGKPEVWTARQQQWWYEVAERSHVLQTAIACRACRKQRRELNAETTKRIWMARFATFQRLAPDVARLVRPGFDEEPRKTRLADFNCTPAVVEKLEAAGVITVDDLVALKITNPLEGVSLHGLKLLLEALKRKRRAAKNGYAWNTE